MMNTFVRNNLTCLFSKNSSFICKTYHVYFSTSNELKQSINTAIPPEIFLHKHNFSPEVASHVAPVVTTLKNQQNSDSVLSFLKDIGFTKSQLEKTLKLRPRLLLSNLENIIKPKINILQDFGFSLNDIAHMISKEPGILHTSAQKRLIPVLSSFKALLGSNVEVVNVLRKSGWLLVTDLEKSMMPNIEFLKSCGVGMEQIIVLLNYLPGVLVYRPELMKKRVEKVNEMGVDKSSKMFVYALCVVGSMTKQSWDIKLQAFRNVLEFSDDDISRVLKQSPLVFKVSEDKIKKVKEIVLATGKYKASCFIKCPRSVMFSIEKRFKPRFHVLEILESRHLITKWPGFGTVCRMSDDKFLEQFVRPYKYEINDVDMRRMIRG